MTNLREQSTMDRFGELFTPQRKKWFLIIGGSVISILLIGLIYVLSVRTKILDETIIKVQQKLKEDYALTLDMQEYGFSGLTAVKLRGVKVTPDSADRLMAVDELEVSVKLLPLLSKKIRLDELNMENAFLTLVKKDSTSNYDFLFRRDKSLKDSTADTTNSKRNLAKLADELINQAFDKIPYNMDLTNVELSYADSSGTQRMRLPEGKVRSGSYDIDVFLNESEAKWNFAGRIDRKNQEFSVTISSDDSGAQFPFLKNRFGLAVKFDQLTFDLREVKRHNTDQLMLLGDCEVRNIHVNHHRLSDKDIFLPQGIATGGILISENSLQVVEGTSMRVKDFEFKPQVKYTNEPSKVLELGIHTGKFEAQNFFDAVPKGLFETIEGIEVDGQISYDLDFTVDFDKPDELTFVSKIDDAALKVKKWGNADISKLNQPFVQEVYEDTTKMRNILLGPTNKKFTPLDQVSPILRVTVLNTEDPFFYEHKGFEEEAFKLSIVTNIKEKAFKRGASTISMQLVKNLYLNRNKTMMRKFEEILLVWLMEHGQQVSKDRLFEIYLNIIEWGKDVYGIKEAANYYFGKEPSEINIGESLFLSSIIPRPKTGLSAFDYTGHLKPWTQRHFNTYGYIMHKRDQLQNVEVPSAYGFYNVVLQPGLRPPRPRGVVDSIPSNQEMHDMIDEIDMEEQRRRTLLERLFGKQEEKQIQDTTTNN